MDNQTIDRVEIAKQNFKNGYNCSQSVIMAFSDLFGMDSEIAARFAEGFGGGMGRMRGVCGAVTAMYMLAGLKYSKGIAKDIDTRELIYSKVQELSREFEKINGTTVCGDLLGINKPSDESARPEERTEAYYKKRPCVDCVGDAAEIVQRILCK